MAKPLSEVENLHELAPEKSGGFWHVLKDYLTTVDHKKIGLIYMTIGVLFLVIGGVQALLMRVQLTVPNNDFVSYDLFNQLFTMHGTNMIFFAAMPLIFGLINYVMPLQIGARDVAFPFMNALSVWCTLAGAILANLGFFFGGAADAGWFSYAPVGLPEYSTSHGMDFFLIGLQIAGFGTLMGAINFITTILNMRAPGMTLMRMPLFTWTSLVSSGLILFAFPPLAIGLFLYTFDRLFGANFFDATMGGNPVLWQHIFWIFGHPEVYIVILPAFGIISEVVSTFSRKRIFGYTTMVVASTLIGFIGFMVWIHHMFTVGLGSTANAVFAVATMLVGIPTGIKIFTWIATMWGGRIRFTTAMLFAIGFIPTFVIAGFTGIMLAAAPADYQFTDTYFVVGHFHFTLYGGVVFALFAGFYYWFPKIFGRMMSERLGKLNFWTMIVGFYLTFIPMHFSGMFGMPRRVPTYNAGVGLEFLNMLSTIGAFIMAISVVIFVLNVAYMFIKGEKAGADPWDGRTLEWSIPSPTPEYNFAQLPLVRGLDAFFVEKDAGRREMIPAEGGGPIHLPSNTFLPVVMACGLFIAGFSVIFHQFFFTIVGLGITFCAMVVHSMNDDEGIFVHPEPPVQKEGA